MEKEVSKIIEQEKQMRTGKLSLAEAGLTEIPKDLLEMPWLTELRLNDNEITEIKNLEMLSNLQVLGLSVNRIKEIKCLENLPRLKELLLYSNEITEIKGLENCRMLESLLLNDNPITRLTQLEQLVMYSPLKELYLNGIKSNSLNIPEEIFGPSSGVYNCMKSLTGYFETTRAGVTFIKEVPLILVGNSTAGKTSLLSYLQTGNYPPAKDYSTHGVEPSLWRPAKEMLDYNKAFDLKDLCFYVRDFGGQEYYHSTHRLFFSKKAIYVLLWEQKTNREGKANIPIKLRKADNSIEEVVQPIQQFPYTYWLKTVRFFAGDNEEAPIIMVQNKIDEPVNNQKKYFGDDERKEHGITEAFHLSIKDASESDPDSQPCMDFKNFVRHLLQLAEGQLIHTARQKHWNAIKQVLKKRKNENVWSKNEFLTTLQQLDPAMTENGLLTYGLSLHELGFAFYYPYDDFLKNYIIINPDWVVESVYNILDQTVLESGGELTYEHLLRQANAEHADILLALMKKFELIFENEEDKVYIAPQYLRDECIEKKALSYHKAALPDHGETSSLIVYFPDFMPPSIIQRLITAFGNSAVSKVYWKCGGLFLLNNKHVLIESDKEWTKLMIKAKDHNNVAVWTIFQELRRITNEDNRLWMSIDNGAEYVQISDVMNQINLGNKDSKIVTKNGGSLSVKNFTWLFSDLKKIKDQEATSQKKAIRVFISYAHKDRDYFNLFNVEFKEYLNNSGKYNFINFDDGQLVVGQDWNQKIEQEVEKCDLGILLMSAAFLNSEYIEENELGAMLEKLANRDDFVLCPIYFKNFDFENFDSLKKYQFFKPNGDKYEQADKGTNLCFSHLVKFNNINGVNIPIPNALRDDYLLDLSKAIFKALDEKFQP